MGYWSEMKVDNYEFDICVDGVVMSRRIDTSDLSRLGLAATVAIQVFKGIYSIVEALNSTHPVVTAEDARGVIKRVPNLEEIAAARDFIAALSRQSLFVELPLSIYLVADAAAQEYLSKRSDPRRFSKPKAGFVYLLKSTSGFWKIGKTKNPDNRLKTFGVKLPFEVEYEHLIPCEDHNAAEYSLHQRFEANRVNGEWFDLSPDDVAYIKTIQSL